MSRPARLRHRLRGTALAVVGVLALAGCGSAPPALVAAPAPAPATECGTLRLAVNPWVGYAANSAVIAYLAREELGCEVELVEESEEESWENLASGEVDAILENWGHDDLKKRYIDNEKVIVELGLTGNEGVIGWFVPPWMKEAYPDLTDWRSLREYDDLFRTDASGNQGQLLAGDPGYVTNDQDLVRNLDLNFKVVFAGSEDALIESFREAETNKTPLLGYFYSPQWLLSEIELVNIPLPTYTPGCDADPKTIRCGYQPFALDKIANKKFADSGSPAATLIKNFEWTNADQNEVARDITARGLTPDQAAKKWLDANQKVWRPWLPPSN